MKTLLFISLFFLLSCSTTYIIKGGQDYVRLSEIPRLSPMDRFIIHWQTDSRDTSYAIYDEQSDRMMYLQSYDYKSLLKKDKGIENRIDKTKSNRMLWVVAVVCIIMFFAIKMFQNHNNQE